MGKKHVKKIEFDYVEGIVKGDDTVIKYIYKSFFTSIFNFIKLNNGNKEDAEDIFQEAIIIIYKKAITGNFQLTSSFHTYLYAVCRNLWLKQLKKRSVGEKGLEDTEHYVAITDDLEEIIQHREKFVLFREKFEALGEDCKKVLRMFFERRSMQEICDEMGYSSVQYAKKRKFNCKEHLVEAIKNDKRYQELL